MYRGIRKSEKGCQEMTAKLKKEIFFKSKEVTI